MHTTFMFNRHQLMMFIHRHLCCVDANLQVFANIMSLHNMAVVVTKINRKLKGNRDCKKVGKQVASYLAWKLLANHSISSIGYYLCLFMKTQF